MPNPESSKRDSSKVVKAITPGSKLAHSVTDPSGATEKRIVLNRTSGKLSQRIAMEREQAAAQEPHAATAQAQVAKSSGSKKIVLFTVIGLVIIIGAIGFIASQKGNEPAPAPRKTVAPEPTHKPDAPTPSPLARGLIAYWPFEQSLADATGNQGDGTTGNPPIYVDGKIGNALHLDGTDPVIVEHLTSQLTELQDHFSIAVWVKLPSGTTQRKWPGIVTRGERIFRLSPHLANPREFHVGLLGYKMRGRIVLDTEGNDYPLDTWHHLCAVRDGNSVYLYVNGEIKASIQEITTKLETARQDPLVIGGNPSFPADTPTHRNLIGDVDEVRIYDRALSFEEVNDLANGKT